MVKMHAYGEQDIVAYMVDRVNVHPDPIDIINLKLQ